MSTNYYVQSLENEPEQWEGTYKNNQEFQDHAETLEEGEERREP